MPDTIRSELPPAARRRAEDAYERLREDAEAASAAMALWVAHENTANGTGRTARATAALMAERRALVALAVSTSEDHPLTSRGVAYRLVSWGLPKREKPFRHVEEAVLELRDSGLLPWEQIADETRAVQRHGRWASREEALAWLADTYRRDLWARADVQVQVWVEKRGIASLLAGHAADLGLDVYPTGGFSGAGFVRAAVAEAAQDGRPLVVLYFADSDSSGRRAVEAVERRVRRDAADLGAELAALEPAAVTPEQIRDLGLPTRPDKDSTHRRDHDPEDVVELDAMTPTQLRDALSEAAAAWLPDDLRREAESLEAAERADLARLADGA